MTTRQNFSNIVKYPEEIQKLKDLFSNDISSRFEKPLSASTITNYVGKLDRLSIECLGHGWNGNVDWLMEPKKVIDCIQNSTLSAKKDYLSGVVKYLKHIDAINFTDIISAYQKGMATFKNEEYAKRKDNKATKKQVSNSLGMSEIVSKIRAFKPKDEMDIVDKLICSLFFLNTFVPRGGDLTLLKYVSASKKLKDMSKDFNYVTLNKDGKVVDIIMNAYKSRNTYGTVKFPITKEVADIFNLYRQQTQGQPGEFVFTMRTGKPFSVPNFTDIVIKATKKILGKEMTANLIRSIQITDFYSDGRLKSMNEEDEDSKRFLHSTAVHKEYLKTNLNDSDD